MQMDPTRQVPSCQYLVLPFYWIFSEAEYDPISEQSRGFDQSIFVRATDRGYFADEALSRCSKSWYTATHGRATRPAGAWRTAYLPAIIRNSGTWSENRKPPSRYAMLIIGWGLAGLRVEIKRR